MIAFLRGRIINKQPGIIVIDVGGIGYKVRVSNHTFDRLPVAGDEYTLHIHHSITENDQQLFGFSNTEERNLFELLITVKSIGPRLALALLSSMPPRQVIDAIVHQKSALIAESPGIGKKSAERIVLELRDKLGDIVSDGVSEIETGSVQNEIISALEALGYPSTTARKAVQQVQQKEAAPGDVSEYLKKALKYLQ